MSAPASRDDRLDPAAPELASVLVVVIAAVGEQLIGALAGATGLAPDRAEAIDEREQLGDVVAVAGGQGGRQRDPGRIGQQVVL